MIKIGQIGIGHNHGEGKMLAIRKFPELFEVIGYAEENEKWVEKRGNLPCYKDLPRLSVEEIIEKSDAILVECDVWNLTKVAKMCVEAGKHVHIDKPASGTLAEFEEILNIAKEKSEVRNHFAFIFFCAASISASVGRRSGNVFFMPKASYLEPAKL